MGEPNRLLVVDNDFHAYDIPGALNQAIESLAREGVRWTYYVQFQKKAREAIERGHYHALLIDNDEDVGLRTLAEIVPTHIPIAYVSVFSLEHLKFKHRENGHSLKSFDPNRFEEFGIRVIRKRELYEVKVDIGKEMVTDYELRDGEGVTLETLTKNIYDFLRGI